MQRMQIKPETPAAQVMIVFRVFNIDREEMGLKLIVDPETHRQNETLDLAAEKWMVRPSP